MPEERCQDVGPPVPARPVRLTVCAHVFPDGRLEGTVGAAEANELAFEGWLELLAVLTSLLGSTGRGDLR